ncbi:unnamed protein product [Schistosoma mattheei]|uniref:Uncharacterized protein n=1 Tax=Schistosoma mattheei TaxID=31246 RepID=A0A183PVZ9_9TREM|nr:unnamed protein product [Schistosoma mattheei]
MHRRSDRLFPIHPHNLDKVIQDEWNTIIQWLCDVLSSGDIMCEINPVFTTIQRFINIFGMRLSKTQRIALIRLTVAYICCPNIDTHVIFNALELLNKLMRYDYICVCAFTQILNVSITLHFYSVIGIDD